MAVAEIRNGHPEVGAMRGREKCKLFSLYLTGHHERSASDELEGQTGRLVIFILPSSAKTFQLRQNFSPGLSRFVLVVTVGGYLIATNVGVTGDSLQTTRLEMPMNVPYNNRQKTKSLCLLPG